MRNVVGRFWFLCGFAGLLPVSVIAQNATFSLIPVGGFSRECVGGPNAGQSCTTTSDCEVFPECDRVCKGHPNDGQPCAVAVDCLGAPCEQKCFCNYVITASPGDEIVTEIFGSNWSPMGQHLVSWGFAVEGEVFGDTTAMPKGVDNPQFDCFCQVDADCTECDKGAAPVCWDPFFVCAGSNHYPAVGAFINTARSDYVFFGCVDFPAVDLSLVRAYRYASTVSLDQACAPVYSVPKYFGTLKLIVQDDVCEPFTVSLQSSSASTGMLDLENLLSIEPLDTEGLTVNIVGLCNADCTAPGTGSICGDGDLCPEFETCDDGFTDDCGTCNADCTGPGTGSMCGDGELCPELEACDDGFTDDCGTCNTDCTGPGRRSRCGDGELCPEFETCDGGFTDVCGTCNADCTGPGTGSTCGDGELCPQFEACDDGNTLDGDGCSSTCEIEIAIPTVSAWGLIVVTLFLLTGGKIIFGARRRRLSAQPRR